MVIRPLFRHLHSTDHSLTRSNNNSRNFYFGLVLSTLGGYVLVQFNMPGRNFLAYMLLFLQ